MKITKLSIENFLAIGEAQASLEDKGLCLVQGENLDDPSQISNGAGKSTLLDAISWALWGITARGVSGDDVVNTIAKKDCAVHVQVDDGGVLYSISRYRKHQSEKNRLCVSRLVGKEWEDFTGGTDKLTQKLVNKIIGCSVDVFNAAVYIGQEQMPNLPAMTDKQLKLLIEEAAGINTLQEAYSLACDRRNDSKQTLEKLRVKASGFDDRLSDAKRAIANIESQHSDWQMKKDIKVAEAVNGIKRRREEVQTDKRRFDSEYPDGDRKIRASIARGKRKIDSVSVEEKEKAALEKNCGEAQTEQTMWKIRLDNLLKEFSAAERKVKNIERQVGKNCGECGKEYNHSDIAEAKGIAEKRLKKVLSDVKEAKNKSDVAKNNVLGNALALRNFVDNMTDISKVVKLHSKLEKDLTAYQNQKAELERRKACLLTDFEAAKQLKAESNPFVSVLSEHKKQLTDIERLRQTAKNDVSIAEKNLHLATAVTTVYGQKGVRAHILDTVTPFLNERTSSYLTQLSDGNIEAQWNTLTKNSKGELKEKFSIDVESKTGAKTFKGLSGGEKRKVRLACSMALQDLVASRATKPLDLYICDEIDDALDSAGLERLMNVLKSKSMERGTVLVVSHNDLKSWINQSVLFVKENGKATMTGNALSC